MDLLTVVYNAIIGINVFQAFWISGLILLIAYGWHNDLVQVVKLIDTNQHLKEWEWQERKWKRQERNLNIGLIIVGGLFAISVVWMAIVGLK